MKTLILIFLQFGFVVQLANFDNLFENFKHLQEEKFQLPNTATDDDFLQIATQYCNGQMEESTKLYILGYLIHMIQQGSATSISDQEITPAVISCGVPDDDELFHTTMLYFNEYFAEKKFKSEYELFIDTFVDVPSTRRYNKIRDTVKVMFAEPFRINLNKRIAVKFLNFLLKFKNCDFTEMKIIQTILKKYDFDDTKKLFKFLQVCFTADSSRIITKAWNVLSELAKKDKNLQIPNNVQTAVLVNDYKNSNHLYLQSEFVFKYSNLFYKDLLAQAELISHLLYHSICIFDLVSHSFIFDLMSVMDPKDLLQELCMAGMVLSNIPKDLMDLNVLETETRCHVMRSIVTSHKFNKTEWHAYKYKPSNRESGNTCKDEKDQKTSTNSSTDESSSNFFNFPSFDLGLPEIFTSTQEFIQTIKLQIKTQFIQSREDLASSTSNVMNSPIFITFAMPFVYQYIIKAETHYERQHRHTYFPICQFITQVLFYATLLEFFITHPLHCLIMLIHFELEVDPFRKLFLSLYTFFYLHDNLLILFFLAFVSKVTELIRPNIFYLTSLGISVYLFLSSDPVKNVLVMYCTLICSDKDHYSPSVFKNHAVRFSLYILSLIHFQNYWVVCCICCCIHKIDFPTQLWSIKIDLVVFIVLFYKNPTSYFFCWIVMQCEEESIQIMMCCMPLFEFYNRKTYGIPHKLFVSGVLCFKFLEQILENYGIDSNELRKKSSNFMTRGVNKIKESLYQRNKKSPDSPGYVYGIYLTMLVLFWCFSWTNFLFLTNVVCISIYFVYRQNQERCQNLDKEEIQNLENINKKIDEFAKNTFPVSEEIFQTYLSSKKQFLIKIQKDEDLDWKKCSKQSFQTKCLICKERLTDSIFLPCKHVCCCFTCSLPMKNCPICQCILRSKLKFRTRMRT